MIRRSCSASVRGLKTITKMRPETIILIYLTVPAIAFVVLLICIELNVFRMVIVIVLACFTALFERLKMKYEQAIKEIDETLQYRSSLK